MKLLLTTTHISIIIGGLRGFRMAAFPLTYYFFWKEILKGS